MMLTVVNTAVCSNDRGKKFISRKKKTSKWILKQILKLKDY